MINQIPAIAEGRQPRAIIKINGIAVDGWIHWEVQNNSFYQADTFSVSFAVSLLSNAYSVDWFSAQTVIAIEIFAGFPNNADSFTQAELTSLIYGNVDSVSYNPVSTIIELSGRDLTYKLIDEKTTQKYPNQTASEIATSIAKTHGLTPVVTKTKAKSGTFYQIDHARLNDTNSDWDLLTYLANQEGYRVYVKGQSLYFEPDTSATAEPYILHWQLPNQDSAYPVFNGMSLDFSRNLNIAKGSVVTVRSWNSKQKKAFNVSYPTKSAKGIAPGKASAPAQVYSYTIAGLTPEQALQRAQTLYKNIVQHEMKMQVSLPADNILMPTSVIKFEGTNTSFDQLYYPESVTRTMSIDDGYMMTISAKNHSPENDPLI